MEKPTEKYFTDTHSAYKDIDANGKTRITS